MRREFFSKSGDFEFTAVFRTEDTRRPHRKRVAQTVYEKRDGKRQRRDAENAEVRGGNSGKDLPPFAKKLRASGGHRGRNAEETEKCRLALDTVIGFGECLTAESGELPVRCGLRGS